MLNGQRAVLCQIKLRFYIWLFLQINFSRGGAGECEVEIRKERGYRVWCHPLSPLFIIIEGQINLLMAFSAAVVQKENRRLN